eukprot:CAMPEP_0115529652 /NCGR_PEP_ID=MMETSP0271-20121206/84066_1 /TAXON_ID=71861 /ORGANISM="Scrippsiella trochoidea, Strain CCMP3099" /LENGTH=198 /DNA_ID=CAMNT_0002961709 /DNA_START=17 /DNA_END=610 /DNA_ORIENTATION=+
MGNVQGECTPHLVKPENHPECCTPHVCGQGIDPLDDRECADILLVNGTVRGELDDVRRALEMGASPNTVASLCLKMGEPAKGKRKSCAKYITPLMRASELGHEDVVVTLMEARASPVQCDRPLCYALGAAQLDVARRLLELSDVKKRKAQKDNAMKLHTEIIAKCEEDMSKEAADLVDKEFATLGLLANANEIEAVPG